MVVLGIGFSDQDARIQLSDFLVLVQHRILVEGEKGHEPQTANATSAVRVAALGHVAHGDLGAVVLEIDLGVNEPEGVHLGVEILDLLLSLGFEVGHLALQLLDSFSVQFGLIDHREGL